ncbi:MAG: hypothetical protein MJE68_16700, partial [Proteobacteria bacterium]|nr:hypothetical protein [Pseudomonadota bacterium]
MNMNTRVSKFLVGLVSAVVVGGTLTLALPSHQAHAQARLELWNAEADGTPALTYGNQTTHEENGTVAFFVEATDQTNGEIVQINMRVETKGAYLAATSRLVTQTTLTHEQATTDGSNDVVFDFEVSGNSNSVTLDIDDDNLFEEDGYIIVTLLPPSQGQNYTIGNTSRTTVTMNITNDDDLEVTVRADNDDLLYGEAILLRTTAPRRNQQYDIVLGINDPDGLTGLTTTTVDLPDGITPGSQEIPTDQNTSVVTGRSTITFTAMDNATAGYVINASTRTFSVDVSAPPTLSAANSMGDEGTSADVTFSINHRYPADIVVTYNTNANGTAGASDFTAVSGGMVTIMAGDTNANATVGLAFDTVSESNETFSVTGTAAIPVITSSLLGTRGTMTSAAATATVTIVDASDDPLLQIEGPSVVRPGANATFTIRNVGNTATNEVGVDISADGAAGGGWYTGPTDTTSTAITGNGSALTTTIPANGREGVLIVTAPPDTGMPMDDIVLTLLNSAFYNVNTTADAHIARVRVFSVGTSFVDGAGSEITTASVAEGDNIVLNVTLDPPQTSEVRLDYTTVDGAEG